MSACVTGKTITLRGVAERARTGTVAVFAPALNVVDQLLASWRHQYGGRMRATVVCSDETIGRRRDDDTVVTAATEHEDGDRESAAEQDRDDGRLDAEGAAVEQFAPLRDHLAHAVRRDAASGA